MSDANAAWFRNLLIIPLSIGVALALVTYVIPKVLEKGKELSDTTEGPSSYLSPETIGNISVTVKVNGVPATRLFVSRIRIWNSGGVSLRGVPVRVVFSPSQPGFRIPGAAHATTPKFEFGRITEEASNDTLAKRFVFELLNLQNQDLITIVTNQTAGLGVYSNVEGMRLKRVEPAESKKWSVQYALISGVIATFASLLSSLLLTMTLRKRPTA